MFENLSERLEKAFKNLKGKGVISEINVAQTMKEIRKALIKADVDFKTAKSFTANKIEKKPDFVTPPLLYRPKGEPFVVVWWTKGKCITSSLSPY